jgi:hypothetical protein
MRKTTMGILCMIGLCGCLLDIEKRPMNIPDAAADEGEIMDGVMDAEAESHGDEVPPLCGDGLCDSAYGETCFNCPADCPVCACITSEDCPAGYVCDDGHCRPGCTTDTDCHTELVCVGGVCVGDASVLCSNGVDDDMDGYVDCDDSDCSTNGCVPFCLPEHDQSRCTDGLDNDMDGKTDCEDEQCLFNLNVSACTCGSGSGRECGTDTGPPTATIPTAGWTPAFRSAAPRTRTRRARTASITTPTAPPTATTLYARAQPRSPSAATSAADDPFYEAWTNIPRREYSRSASCFLDT